MAEPRPLSLTTFAAIGAVLAWFAVQLAPFVGEAPELDAMVSLREALVFHREGLGGLVSDSVGAGVHPPVLDLVSSAAFTVLGEDPRSQQLVAVLVFVVLVAAVERLLAPWLSDGKRIVAAFAVAICPSLAIAVFLMAREGLVLAVLATALALALRPGARRPFAIAAVLTLLPLIKESAIVLVVPFAVDAALSGDGSRRERLRRGALVLLPAVAAALVWRGVLALAGGSVWKTWIVSEHADDGPYVVALRAMFMLEDGIFLRQNLANAFVVNYLWLPALLALVTIGLVLARRPAPPGLRRAIALIAGLAVLYAWTTLAFPTFTVPRYAAPLTMLTILLALLGLPLWPRRAQPVVLAALLIAFAAGAWSPTDPVSRAQWGTTSVGGEQVYDTAERERGPDRIAVNFAVLRAGRRANERLRRVYASEATVVTGDCDALKLGEKLHSIGLTPSAYDRALPGARPLSCVRVEELPPDAADGPDLIALIRTVEDEATGRPLPLDGPSVIVIR